MNFLIFGLSANCIKSAGDSNIRGVSQLYGITAGGDFLGLCTHELTSMMEAMALSACWMLWLC
jgi:hypothetical protein